MNKDVKIKLVRKNAKMPFYATDGAAAFDLHAAIDEPVTIPAHDRKMIPTGIAISIPDDSVAILCARSGLACKKGITAANGIGVIDSDYRGEISFCALNTSDEDYTVEPDERIAQLMIMPVFHANLIETDELDETVRGQNGFGSTGKQ